MLIYKMKNEGLYKLKNEGLYKPKNEDDFIHRSIISQVKNEVFVRFLQPSLRLHLGLSNQSLWILIQLGS